MTVRKCHHYINVFADLIQKRILFAPEDKNAGVWPKFIEPLKRTTGIYIR